MPIYAYKCSACGHAQDVLQKVSDAPLSQCPHCRAETYVKQLTAAGFQLKGSGWYATDFKNGSAAKASKAAPAAKAPDTGTTTTTTTAKSETGASAAPAGGACGHGGCSSCS